MRGYFGFPPYLTAVIEDYFRGRRLTWRDADGKSSKLPSPGCSIICYADDTLILAGGIDWGKAVRTANFELACVVRSIRNLGLVVAERKTVAMFLHRRRMKPPQAQIRVGRVRVPIEAQMRYLGLTLNGTWCFREHFNRLVPRLRAVSAYVGRLMPRIEGPDGMARLLHAGILNSVALYRAPIWAEALAVSRPMQATLCRVHRALAVRVARCYRTVSHVGATALASMPPSSS
ncbi:uncharacterized protein LOC112589481 [Harpegnathos saltator]|uniref:uncharacterized protein LOC112589481 n=1 Tax=Harpegnathos saltator TaxID=610380 RepID=UPI000DBED1A2|nr:uncharacterized protein LOC112589481 [Harpegnathos saltator]